MKRITRNVFLLSALFFICNSNTVSAQTQTCGSENLSPIFAQSPTIRNIAQSFKLCETSEITSISIQRRKSPGTDTERQGILNIYKGSGTTGTPVHTQAMEMPKMKDNENVEVVTLQLTSAFTCLKDTEYTFQIDSKIVTNNALILVSANGQNPYLGGNAFFDNKPKASTDFWFQLGVKKGSEKEVCAELKEPSANEQYNVNKFGQTFQISCEPNPNKPLQTFYFLCKKSTIPSYGLQIANYTIYSGSDMKGEVIKTFKEAVVIDYEKLAVDGNGMFWMPLDVSQVNFEKDKIYTIYVVLSGAPVGFHIGEGTMDDKNTSFTVNKYGNTILEEGLDFFYKISF